MARERKADGGQNHTDPLCETKRFQIWWMFLHHTPTLVSETWSVEQRIDFWFNLYFGHPFKDAACDEVDLAWRVCKRVFAFFDEIEHPHREFQPGPGADCETLRARLVVMADQFHSDPRGLGDPMERLERAARLIYGHGWKDLTCPEVEEFYRCATRVYSFLRDI